MIDPDFTPNPNRKHSRGRRGKYVGVCGDEQQDFVDAHQDVHETKQQSLRQEFVKRERARAKSFLVRGLRTTKKVVESGRQGISPKQAARIAHRYRATHTSRAIMGVEVPENVAVKFDRWQKSRELRRLRAIGTSPPKPRRLLIREEVALFRKTGKTSVPYNLLQNNGPPSLSRREFKEFVRTVQKSQIESELVKSGLETNPGPACQLRNQPVCLSRDGKKVCPRCNTPLKGRVTRHSNRLWMNHPDMGDAEIVTAELFPQSLTQLPSFASGTCDDSDLETLCIGLQCPPEEVPPPVKLPVAESEPKITMEPAHPCPPSKRCEIVEEIQPSSLMDEPEKSEHQPVLSGRLLNKAELRELELQRGMGVSQRTFEVPYTEDDRLITNRNVKPVEEAIQIVELAFVPARRNWFLRMFRCTKLEPEPAFLYYSPHLLACLLCEYDSTMTLDVVSKTVAQKYRRMASAPIPANLAVEVKEGTCYLVTFLHRRQRFHSSPSLVLGRAV